MRARIATDLVAVLENAEASMADGQSLPDPTQFSLLQTALGGPFDRLLATEVEGGVPFLASPKIGRIAGLLAPRTDLRAAAEQTINGPTVDEDGEDGGAAEVAAWLNDNLFTDANHAGDGIFNVPASLVCTETVYDNNGNEIGEAVDPECANAFAKIELRIRVTTDDDLLRFALQVGPKHDEPLEVGLGPNLLSLTVDLDEAEQAARALASKLGGELPSFALDGRVTATLEAAPATARITLAIDRAVSIRFAKPGVGLDDDDAFRFASAKATVFALSLDGNQRTMEAALALGETRLHVPSELDGTIDLDLPGLTGTASYGEQQPLRISNVSLGDRTTTLKVDGTTAVAIDLNPDDGRQFSAVLQQDLLEVTPRVDFRAQLNHAALGDGTPVYDITRIVLEGGLRNRADDQLEVVGGPFAIETNPASYGFSAANGQCVSGTEAYDSGTGESYTVFAVGACN